MNTTFKLAMLGSALALAAGPVAAVDYYLCAGATTKTLPDGSSVPIWGFAEDDDADLSNGCGNAVTVPGPRLTVPVGDTSLNINLRNDLLEPTSLVIPGLPLPVSVGAGPTWNDNTTGARANLTQRVRSFGAEAAAGGGTETYSWSAVRPGTFLYHSGTHPQKQVYMGLYGAATHDAADGIAYNDPLGNPLEATAYDNEVVLFYSEIDPVLNGAISDGTYTTSIDYQAQWFLVNGEPYEPGVTPDIPAGNAVTGPGDTRSNTLIRFLSAAGETHVPVLQGGHMTIHAEDGLLYTWQDGATGDQTPAPREQYSAMLPALKTKDAIFVASAMGRYAVYDGNGYMTNPSDPEDFTTGDQVGGMLRFLSVAAANQAPVAVDDFATTPEDTPIDINVVVNDTDPNGDGLTLVSVTQGALGTATISAANCCVLYTPNANANGVDSFDYTVTDSNGVTSTATAVVTVTVAAVNDVPSITSTPVTTATTSQPYSYDVEASDADLGDTPPDVLTYSLTVAPVGMTIDSTNGLISWTPNVQQDGIHPVSVVVTDLALTIATQQFDIDVTLVNVAPVISTDPVTTAIAGQPYTYDVDATDEDLGDTQTYSLDAASIDRGMTIDAATGVIDWTPTMAQLGGNDVTVTVTDFHGLTTSQSFTVTVDAALGALFFSTLQNVAVPGVTGTNNNADIYAYDGAVYSRILDTGFAGNMNALQIVDADTFYLSFANNNAVTNGGLTLEDEDIAFYDAGVWTVYFDGSANGLGAANGYDIDAFSIDGGVLYFSTVGNVNVGGLGAGDDADIYSWNGTAYARVFDASAAGLPGNADIDGLTVKGGTYYMSFLATATNVAGLGAVADTAVVSYSGGVWSSYFTGPGLTAGTGQDLDAVHVP